MLDMGFMPQVDKIVRRLPSNRQTMFFSATLDGEAGELARAYTNSPSRFEADLLPERAGRDRAPLRRGDGRLEGRDARRAHLERSESTLVFVRTKRGADRLVQKLKRHGVGAAAMHGDMSQRARERALARLRAGQGRRRWSQPTSPPAAWTWTTSRT